MIIALFLFISLVFSANQTVVREIWRSGVTRIMTIVARNHCHHTKYYNDDVTNRHRFASCYCNKVRVWNNATTNTLARTRARASLKLKGLPVLVRISKTILFKNEVESLQRFSDVLFIYTSQEAWSWCKIWLVIVHSLSI